MAQEDIYYQCLLKFNQATQTAYIPERYAHTGNFVKLKEGDDWINGWVIVSVGAKATGADIDLVREARLDRRATIDG